MKLKNISQITGQIELLSGLHIGGGDTSMRIGGADSTVIKHPRTSILPNVTTYPGADSTVIKYPRTNQPYIPGSSLKGKIRSLLEWRSGAVKEKPLSWRDYVESDNPEILGIIKLFGISGGESSDAASELGPTRISVADCMVNEDYANEVKPDFCEIKSENSINRITGTALNPRFIERVQVGTVFDLNITIRHFDQDSEDLQKLLFAGMRLLELDSLGASGSRGYGKVKFCDLLVDGKTYQEKFDAIDPFDKS